MTLVSTVSVPHPASSRYPARAGAAIAKQAPSASTAANPVLLLFMTPPPDRGLPVPTPLLADPPPVRERPTRATGHGSGCARTTTSCKAGRGAGAAAPLPAARRALLRPHHRVRGQQGEEVLERALDVVAVLRLERQLHRILGIGHLRVGAEQQVGKDLERRVQVLGDRAFAVARVDDAQEVGRGGESLPQRGELLLEDLRDA